MTSKAGAIRDAMAEEVARIGADKADLLAELLPSARGPTVRGKRLGQMRFIDKAGNEHFLTPDEFARAEVAAWAEVKKWLGDARG